MGSRGKFELWKICERSRGEVCEKEEGEPGVGMMSEIRALGFEKI